MTKEELLKLMEAFLAESGQYGKFIDYIDDKGYTEEEIDAIIKECDE
jgi:hypothetical protein